MDVVKEQPVLLCEVEVLAEDDDDSEDVSAPTYLHELVRTRKQPQKESNPCQAFDD